MDRQGKGQLTTPAHERLQPSTLLEDLEENYKLRGLKSIATTLSHLIPLKLHFRGCKAIEVDFRAVSKYTQVRLTAKKSDATVNRELELLRRALNLGHQRGLLLTVPKIELLPENNTRTGFFERAESEALVVALPVYLQDFCRFAYITGMRLGEIKSLRLVDVDLRCGDAPTPG